MIPDILISALALVIAPADDPAARLTPLSVEQAFVTPDVPARLRWQGTNLPEGPIASLVRDAAGATVCTGLMKRTDAGELELEVRLPRGFYEIEIPATHQRFGVVAQPAWQGPPDPFFAIDAALSWLVANDRTREGLIATAHRSGVSLMRERLSWGGVHPTRERWDWETGQRFDRLRRTYERLGVPILEMAHDGPAWLGRVGNYPDDLVATAESWRGIAGHWSTSWGAVELWNEPDIFFGGDLPADQYGAVAKAVAFGIERAGAGVPAVGGVMANDNPAFLDACARGGLLDRVAVFSFHTYGPAVDMESLVGKYRGWLRAHDRGAMPLWISECGRPWTKGPERPPVDQDATSALDITMKAVEARACGVARYFPFVYPYFEEHANNFGMMDRQATPLRSFAAYVQMIRVLGSQSYLGDLRTDLPELVRARVFGDDRQRVAVLYTARVEASATVKLGLKAARLEGIDGRALEPAADGAIPIPDGLTYAWLDRDVLGDRLVSDTPAKRLHAGATPAAPLRAASPIVLRYQFDPARVQPSSGGYRILADAPHELPLMVRAFNLSDAPVAVDVDLAQPEGDHSIQRVEIPAGAHSDLRWTLDLDPLFGAVDRATVLVRASDGLAELDRVAIVLQGEPDLARAIASAVRLPITDLVRWSPSIAGGGTMTMESTPEAAWRLTARQPGVSDRWVYPLFRLPDDVPLERARGLIVRARCLQPAVVRLFLWEGDTGVGYITPNPIIPADGRWHVARVNFADLIASPANAPDPNHRLDLDTVRRLSIGMNHHQDENTLEVSDLDVVTDPK